MHIEVGYKLDNLVQNKTKEMGICGLNSFLKANPQLAIGTKLHDQKLVIDGKNLAFHLFNKTCNSPRYNDWRCDVYGGNMVSYAEEVRKFFEKINKCKIEPLVVISGRRNIDDDSTRQKVQQQFDSAKNIDEYTEGDDLVIPSCIKTVFTSVLDELCINIHVANNYTATIRDMANENDCPVLTNDGAFFIYNLKRGHILLDTFDHEKLELTGSGDGYSFSKCNIYTQRKLLDFFPRLNLSYLPLLAATLTYTKSNSFKRVSTGLAHLRYRGELYVPSEPQRRIINLLTYFEGKTLKSILDFYLSKFDSREQTSAWVRIQDAMINFWGICDEDLETKIKRFYKNYGDCDVGAYLFKRFTSGELNTILYDIISGQIHFNYPEIDDLNKESSFHMMLRPLSVVLALMKRPYVRKDDNKLVLIDHPYCEHTIEPMEHLEGFGSLKQESIHETVKMSMDKKKRIILRTFRCDEEIFDKITELMTNRFKDKPYIHQAVICMLLLRYINLEAKTRDLHDHLKREFVAAILVTILHYESENGNIDCPEGKKFKDLNLMAIKNTSARFKPSTNIYRPVMHLIAELQTAFKAFFLLNTLLDYPFEQPKLELFFNGVLIYNVTQELVVADWNNGDVLLDYGFIESCNDIVTLVKKADN